MSKVSVIIPTYNRIQLLTEAIESVLSQESTEVEIIVIDDGSDQECQTKLNTVVELNENIHLIRNKKNLGVSASRNVGIQKATGDYIMFLDDDDVLLPDMLKKSLAVIEAGNLDVVSCRSEVVGSRLSPSRLKGYNWQQYGRLNVYNMNDLPMEHIFLYHPQIHTFLVRRIAVDTWFSSALNYGEDILFWLVLAGRGLQFEKLDFVGCKYRLHETNASNQVDYRSKINFYLHLPDSIDLSAEMRNIRLLRMAYWAWRQRDLRFAGWLLRSLSRPDLLFKHVRYHLMMGY